MSTFTKKLLSVLLAAAMVFGNAAPAAAADYGSIFDFDDGAVEEEFFAPEAQAEVNETPAAAAPEYELIDPAAIKDSAVANSYQNGETHPEWHDGPASWAFDGNTQTAWHTKYDEGGVDDRPNQTGNYTIEWSVGGGTVFVGKLGYLRKDGADNSVNGRWKTFKVYGKAGSGGAWLEIPFQREADAPEGADIRDVPTGEEAVILFDEPMAVTHLKVEILSTNYGGQAGMENAVSAGEIRTYRVKDANPEPPTNPVEPPAAAEVLENRDVNFYIYLNLNEEPVVFRNLKNVSTLWVDGHQLLDAEVLESVYRPFGFTARKLTAGSKIIGAAVRDGEAILVQPALTHEGKTYAVAPVGRDAVQLDVFYLPAAEYNLESNSKTTYSNFTIYNSFFSVTNQVTEEVLYFPYGSTAEIRLENLGGGGYWQCLDNKGHAVRGVIADGHTTFTIDYMSKSYQLKWHGKNYSVTFQTQPDPQQSPVMHQISVLEGTRIGSRMVDDPVAPEGQRFVGWFTSEGEQITADTLVDRQIVCWARFESLNAVKHDVTFVAEGQDNVVVQVENGQTIGRQLPDAPAAPEGQVFKGWFDENGTEVTGTTEVTGPMTVTARFESAIVTLPDRTVRFYAVIDGQPVLMQERTDVTTYWLSRDNVFRQCVDAETLVSAYGKLGFTAEALTPGSNLILHSERKDSQDWVYSGNTAEAGGKVYACALGNQNASFDLFYLPTNSDKANANLSWPAVLQRETFYTVTVKDNQQTHYFLNGTEAVVTLEVGSGNPWLCHGADKTFVRGTVENGVYTVTIPAIQQPYEIAREGTYYTVSFHVEGRPETSFINVEEGHPVGDRIPEAPPAPEGQRFIGWYFDDTKLTPETVITHSINCYARFVPDVPAVVNVTAKINGSPVGGENLADVLARSGVAADAVTSLEFVSGKVTKDDLLKVFGLPNLVTFKCNLSETLTADSTLLVAGEPLFPEGVFSKMDYNTSTRVSNVKLQTAEINGFMRMGFHAFEGCTALTSVTADQLWFVGGNSFCGDTALTTVHMPALREIAGNAFEGTTALKTMDLSHVTYIGQYAFSNSGIFEENGVITLTLPACLTEMLRCAFGFTDHDATFHVTMEGTTPPDLGAVGTIGNNNFAFYKPTPDSYVEVPQGAEDAYKADTTHYDAEKNTWACLHLGKPVVVENVTLTFVNGETSTTVEVEKGTAIGTKLPAAPTAPDGKVFVGWFSGDVQATAETRAEAAVTYTAKFDLDKNTQRNVRFYIYLDKALHLVEEQEPVTTYWIGGRQCLDVDTLKAVYGGFGFTAENLTGTSHILHADRPGDGSFWNAGVKTLDGVTYAATVNHNQEGPEGKNIDVIYLPKATVTGSVGKENAATMAAETFYYVGDEESGRYFVNGETAVIEKNNLPGQKWILTGADGNTVLEGVKGEERTTFTIENISQSYTESLVEDTPVVVNAVAKIGEQGYETLHAAFAAAQDGETVQVLKNITFGAENEPAESITVSNNVTLDLNGCTVIGGTDVDTAAKTIIVSEGSLTVEDTAGSGRLIGRQLQSVPAQPTAYWVDSNRAIQLQSNATVTVNGGTIIGEDVIGDACFVKGYAIDAGAGQTNQSVVVNGGIVIGSRVGGSCIDGNQARAGDISGTGVSLTGTGSVAVNGGIVIGAQIPGIVARAIVHGISTKDDITVTGGTVYGLNTGGNVDHGCKATGVLLMNSGSINMNMSAGTVAGVCTEGILSAGRNGDWRQYIGVDSNSDPGPHTLNITGGRLYGAITVGTDPNAQIAADGILVLGSTLTVNDAEVMGIKATQPEGSYRMNEVCGITAANNATVTVGGSSTVTGGMAVAGKASTITINGGTFRGTDKEIGSLTRGGCSLNGFPTISVTGGYFAHEFADVANPPAYLAENKTVQRGNLVDGTWTPAADGSLYKVVEQVAAAARIGNQTYETLHAAFAAAQADETVQVLKDITFGAENEPTEIIAVNAAVTLDLSGHTVVGNRQDSTALPGMFQVQAGGHLTVSDTVGTGKLIGTQLDQTAAYDAFESRVILLDNEAALSVTGGTVIGTHIAGDTHAVAGYPVQAGDSAVITVSGGTVIGARVDGNLLKNFNASRFRSSAVSLTSGSITVSGDANITGMEVGGTLQALNTNAVDFSGTMNVEGNARILGLKAAADLTYQNMAVGIASSTSGQDILNISGGSVVGVETTGTVRSQRDGVEVISARAVQISSNASFENHNQIHVTGGDILGAKAYAVDRGNVYGLYLDNFVVAEITGGTVRGVELTSGPMAYLDNGSITAAIAVDHATLNVSGGNVLHGMVRGTGTECAARAVTVKDGTVNITGGVFQGNPVELSIHDRYSEGTVTVSGGIFTHDFIQGKNDPAFLAAGKITQRGNLVDGAWTADENGNKYKVIDEQPAVVNVAQVVKADGTTTGYPTLDAAVKAAVKGDTVELLRDIELNDAKALVLGSLTLDLKGHSIVNTERPNKTLLEIKAMANVTIQDTVGGGKIVGYRSTEPVTTLYNTVTILPLKDSKLTINGGEIICVEAPSVSHAQNISAINNLGKLTVNGGSVIAFRGQTASDSAQINAIKSRLATGSVFINGGLVSGGNATVDATSELRALRLEDATKATVNGGVLDANGSEFSISVSASSTDPVVTVNGGVFAHDFAEGGNNPAYLAENKTTQRGDLSGEAWTPSETGAQYKVVELVTANYTVKHLQQNVADDNYTLAHTETLNGKVGDQTAAAAKTYEGFTAQAVTQQVIEADGSTVIEIRYNRSTFTVTAVDNIPSTNDVYENVRYGATFGSVVPENPVQEGFTFQGWNTKLSADGQTITADTVLTGEITVYALWERTQPQGVCMIQETKAGYETVAEAAKAAQAGQHIVMLQDAAEDMVALRKGVTLDLNGKTLTAEYVLTFKGNHIVDTTAHLGKLIVTSSIALDENNAQMAVFDVDGYRFGNMLMNQELETPDSNTMTVWMKPFFVDKDTTLPMFSNGAKDNQISMGAALTWTRADGSTATQTFVFSDSMVAQTYTKGTMKVIITGIEGLQNVQVRTMVISDTGIISYGENLLK